jgi:adenylate cyclase
VDRPFPAYRGAEPYAFVSYSHEDSSSVFQELIWLNNECSFNIWYDEGIEAGSEWREEIGMAISRSNVFVYFITPRSIDSENCRKELNLAAEEHIPILAIHVEHSELSVGIKLTLSDRQAILKYELPRQVYREKTRARISAYLDQTLISDHEKNRDIDLSAMYTIAVLPFTNMSTSAETGFFADGLSEDILDNLAQIEWLKVISRSASFLFKEPGQDPKKIGEKLNVAYLLEGSIRQSGDSLRITAQLIRTDDSFHVWSKTYERTLVEGFEMQSAVATTIANIAQSELEFNVLKQYGWKQDKSLEGADPIAITHYINAREEYRRLVLAEGGVWETYVQFLINAVEIDENFTAALRLLANAYLQRHIRGRLSLEEARPGALSALGRISKIDSADHFSMESQIHLSLELNYESASVGFRGNLKKNPRQAWSRYHLAAIDAREGRPLAATRQLADATDFAAVPELPLFLAFVAWIKHICGDDEGALKASTRGLKLAPGGRDREYLLRMHSTSLIGLGRIAEAQKFVNEGWFLGRTSSPESYIYLFAAIGETEKAREILSDSRFELIDTYQVAIGHLVLGDIDATFKSIQEGIDNHSPSLIESLPVDQLWDPIRKDPRFDEILKALDEKVIHTEKYIRDHVIQ